MTAARAPLPLPLWIWLKCPTEGIERIFYWAGYKLGKAIYRCSVCEREVLLDVLEALKAAPAPPPP